MTALGLTPPGAETERFMPPQTPANLGGSFLLSEQIVSPGYDALTTPIEPVDEAVYTMKPSAEYNQYLKMHKVMVGQRGAEQLEDIHYQLAERPQPRFLSAAGSAAVESALVQRDRPRAERLALFDKGVRCWLQGIATQSALNAQGPEHLVEHSAPYRLALQVATAPLLRGIISGQMNGDGYRSVFGDCLNIAESSIIQGHLLYVSGDREGSADHLGFGYENNALLAYNRRFSGTSFIVPAFDRADSGHYHMRQTHDLMLIERKNRHIASVTPLEIKAKAGQSDRRRYGALLVRGKMHLSAPNRHEPRHTLEAIAACYEGEPVVGQRTAARRISRVLDGMIKDYRAGSVLAEVAPGRHGSGFRDRALVAANYPGLDIKAA